MSIAWSECFEPDRLRPFPTVALRAPTADWAWGGSDGAGVRVAVIDSGVDPTHPAVGGLAGSVAFEPDDEQPWGQRTVEVEPGDLAGHGTACAGIIRALAPRAEIWMSACSGSRCAAERACSQRRWTGWSSRGSTWRT
jgi:subtilisin family serine protease